jgi:hypothetical protein
MSENTAPRAQTLPIQGFANRIVRGMLRTPLIAPLMGRQLVTLYVTGRKSGREFVIPIAYIPDGDSLLGGSPFAWGRNLRSGDVLPIRLKGKLREADVEVFTDQADVVRLYDRMCRANKTFAGFNKITIDPKGDPSPEDLDAAWAAGARAFRLTPR